MQYTNKAKIKIEDNSELRAETDKLYEVTEQIELVKWSIKYAQHILPLSKVENIDMSDIENGIEINEFWQVGQAVGVGHMKEHSITCPDYAIKIV